MITLTNRPPVDPLGQPLSLLRTPAYRAILAIVTSEDIVGCPTHYYKGRTSPCQSQSCPACADGISWRWHGYLAAWQPTQGLHFLFEMTAIAAEPFVEYRDAHGGLRGCLFEAKRLTPVPNGRLRIQCKPADLSKVRLPQAPDVIRCLIKIWGLSDVEVQVKGTEKNCPKVETDCLNSPRLFDSARYDVTAPQRANGTFGPTVKRFDPHPPQTPIPDEPEDE